MSNFTEFLNSKEVVVLDGAMGTELQRRGYQTTLPLWSAQANLEDPELVKQIHADYIQAGAEVITTNTFRTIKRSYAKVGNPEQAVESTKAAIRIAKEAADESRTKVYVGGSVAPLEDCYEVESVPTLEELEKEHAFQIELIANEGVDFLFGETFNCIKEAEVVAKHAQKTGLPFILGLVTRGDALLSGETIEEVVKVIEKYQPEAILINCSAPENVTQGLQALRKVYAGNIGGYANGIGEPHDDLGWKFSDGTHVEDYLKHVQDWREVGTKIIGGCCGTTPEYVEAITKLVK